MNPVTLLPLLVFAAISFVFVRLIYDSVKSALESMRRRSETVGRVEAVHVNKADADRWVTVSYVAGGVAKTNITFSLSRFDPFVQAGDSIHLFFEPANPDNIAPSFGKSHSFWRYWQLVLFIGCYIVFAALLIANVLMPSTSFPYAALYLVLFGLLTTVGVFPELFKQWHERGFWCYAQGSIVWMRGNIPVVDFMTASGQAIRFASQENLSGTPASSMELGSTIDVFYLRDRPYDARIGAYFSQRWVILLFIFGIGIVLVVAGVWWVINSL